MIFGKEEITENSVLFSLKLATEAMYHKSPAGPHVGKNVLKPKHMVLSKLGHQVNLLIACEHINNKLCLTWHKKHILSLKINLKVM